MGEEGKREGRRVREGEKGRVRMGGQCDEREKEEKTLLRHLLWG